MTTIINKFTPSINIIRDNNIDFKYVTTPNNSLIFKQILDGFFSGGKRSFSIVGSYGSGKSSFLWAAQKTLEKNKIVFSEFELELNKVPEFECISIIGNYNSLIKEFSEYLKLEDINNTKIIFNFLQDLYEKNARLGKGLLIIVDEFGKFLEYASKNNPDRELYFIQQLAEFVNDASKNIIFIVTLHQGFDAYALNLDKIQRQEWDKVKGRLKELSFNEPVEQLLLLAAKRINGTPEINDEFQELFKSIADANAFPLRDYFSIEIAAQLYPFDILSAAILTLALQKYGQNERSLFSFIDGEEHLSLLSISPNRGRFFNLASVYDYLNYNYYYFLNSKQNPDSAQWAGLKSALERLESIDNISLELIEEAKKIIKSIGLLNIFASKSIQLDTKFLKQYGHYALGIDLNNIDYLLIQLEQIHKIILYRKYAHRYLLTEGTDLDIHQALIDAEYLIDPIVNISEEIQKYFSFSYVLAKENYFKYGTPRFFSFVFSNSPISTSPKGEIDGFINLIFSETIKKSEIKKISATYNQNILYGLVKNTIPIKKMIADISIINKVIELNQNDTIAVRELKSMLDNKEHELNNSIMSSIYSTDAEISWYFKGIDAKFNDRTGFNRYLSQMCNEIYHETPKVVFEMINKTKLSGAMLTARKKLLEAMTTKSSQIDLGFENDKFPPEKSIYQALLKQTGIHIEGSNGVCYFTTPTSKDILSLWRFCESFLETTQSNPRGVDELVKLLLKEPIKLKEGFLSFWLPIFIFVKKDEFALFEEGVYVPEVSKDVLELISVKPANYKIKAFNISGIHLDLFNSYRNMLEQSKEIQFSNKIFIDTIKPFLKFYRELPAYVKNTQRLSQEAIALREAIANAKDPEKSFFEDFPTALGYSVITLQANKLQLSVYAKTLQQTIRELRMAFEELISRFEVYLLERLGFENLEFDKYKTKIQDRFKHVKTHLLLPHQKPFYQRINSVLNDRRSWLLSIAQSCLGKQIEGMTDSEEPVLFHKLQTLIHELDNLTELSAQNINEQDEVFYKINISSLADGFINSIDSVRLPKKQAKKIDDIASKVRKNLSDNHELNIAILTQLLQEEIKNGKKG